MEIKVIIWIILGLIYLFARRKKSAPPPPPARRRMESDTEAAPTKPPVTFEELLREIQGAKEAKAPQTTYSDAPRDEEAQSWDEQDYQEPVVERKPLENTQYDYRKEDKIYDVYENARRQAFERPSLEETVKLDDTVVRFKQFKGYETETRHVLTDDIGKELKDPKNFRKAFILSEILQRKF